MRMKDDEWDEIIATNLSSVFRLSRADGIELQVLAAVVIGGVSIWGGSGTEYGAAMGAIVLATINNGLVLLGVQEFYRLIFQGAAIVAAVAVDALVQRRVQSATNRRTIMEVTS